mmetsp:Transcript_21983/g.65903  ORF Transcript_21983/g.65903 Transcript_21983/m.65903 type:complete len:134 (-) Transcript_21983:25-426(-)
MATTRNLLRDSSCRIITTIDAGFPSGTHDFLSSPILKTCALTFCTTFSELAADIIATGVKVSRQIWYSANCTHPVERETETSRKGCGLLAGTSWGGARQETGPALRSELLCTPNGLVPGTSPSLVHDILRQSP